MKQDEDMDGRWERGWDEHKTQQLVRTARLPLSAKLDWLEEAQALSNALSRQAEDDRNLLKAADLRRYG